jgi:hypothetical protein
MQTRCTKELTNQMHKGKTHCQIWKDMLGTFLDQHFTRSTNTCKQADPIKNTQQTSNFTSDTNG